MLDVKQFNPGIKTVGSIAGIIIASILAFYLLVIYWPQSNPYERVEINIPKGVTLSQIGNILKISTIRNFQKFNKEAYASYSDWRLPTRKELKSLYEEDKNIPWKYYWTENMIHIDPIFGYSHCCFWSSELYKDKYAWGFNYIGGKDYPSMKGGGQYHLSLSTIRPVRTVSEKN